MHEIARRAAEGSETIEELTEAFYSTSGPLAEAGWEIRPQQREMSVAFARQIDAGSPWLSRSSRESDGQISLFEAPCGTGKGLAYLIPGVLAALRAEAAWWRMRRARAKAEAEANNTDYREPTPNAKDHTWKLVVSTANIALQSQLIRKDIPGLMEMLGCEVRATLMKSRQNYVCRYELLQAAGKLTNQRDQDLQQLAQEVLNDPRHDGDRETFKWDVSRVWPMVSVGSDDCLRDGCAHWQPDAEVGGCWWRKVTAAWPTAHVIVANHHWAALTRGIMSIGYAVDEAHELEDALRGVQGKTATTASFASLSARLAPLLKRDRDKLDDVIVPVATRVFDIVEDHMRRAIPDAEPGNMSWRSPVPLIPDWTPRASRVALMGDFKALLALRDEVVVAAMGTQPKPVWKDGRLQATSRSKEEEGRRSRGLVNCANRLIDLCQIYAATVKGRPHPAWASSDATWAIWGQRERQIVDGAERWRVVLNFTPADVAPFFAYLWHRYPTMVLTSATLPEFTSMRLSLGLGAKWEREAPLPWPAVLRTDVGELAGHERGSKRDDEGGYSDTEQPESATPDAPPDDLGDEPVSRVVPVVADLAPVPLREERLPSPYPLDQQGILIIPQGPTPNERARWEQWAVEQVVAAVRAADGGALVLATSNAMMNRYATALRAESGGRWQVLKQGDTGRQRLIEEFKSDVGSVLVGTRSFFQGLDVQGESCRLVIVDKVPFASPDDPLEVAVGELLVQRARATGQHRNPTAYLLRTVPGASMVLVQGVGRLIRSQTDRGVVLLLDGRVLQPGPGWQMIIDALPPFPLSRDPRDVLRHLAGAKTSARPWRVTGARLPEVSV